jgi:predicted lysophospholipase L1 biosynthesis ABC-type transport system permease subunit
LGQQVVIDGNIDVTWEVVGVVGDVKQDDLRQANALRGTFYRAYGQVTPPTMRLAVRTRGNPMAVVPSLRTLLQNMDREVPLSGPRTMEDIMANSTISDKALVACLTTFSLLAVILAAVGIYGLLAYVVAPRYRDIGIRMALGATQRNVAWPILREAFLLAATGLFSGGVLAFAATRLIQANLYGVGSGDPLTIAISALVLMGMASLAAWFPAWRAAKVEPMTALRCE